MCAWASLALALTALTPSLASACDCVASTPCQAVANADAVFIGRVISVTEVLDDQPLRRLVRLAVSEWFIGTEAGEVEVRTGVGGGDCGYHFDVGSTYVVYAYRSANGALTTGICSRTAKTALNGAEIASLRQLDRAPTSGGRVTGEVRVRPRAAGSPSVRSAAGVIVTAVPDGGGSPFRTTTDTRGRFEVTLPAGRYRFTANGAPGTALDGAMPAVNVFGGATCARVSLVIGALRQRQDEDRRDSSRSSCPAGPLSPATESRLVSAASSGPDRIAAC